MAALKPEVKTFIVSALACYDTPTQVAEAVKEEFGLVVSRMQVSAYDPHKVQGKYLSKALRELFAKVRAEFDAEVTAIPIAKKTYRLRMLQKTVERAESRKNSALVLQTLEQAAREVGDMFVNRQKTAGDEHGDEPVAIKVERGVKDARRQPA